MGIVTADNTNIRLLQMVRTSLPKVKLFTTIDLSENRKLFSSKFLVKMTVRLIYVVQKKILQFYVFKIKRLFLVAKTLH